MIVSMENLHQAVIWNYLIFQFKKCADVCQAHYFTNYLYLQCMAAPIVLPYVAVFE